MHKTTVELASSLPGILEAPADRGPVEMIVRRPAENERETVDAGHLDSEVGLVGDNWKSRGNPHTHDGAADPLAQLTLMNARVADAVADSRERWPLAGDQIYVDLDLSVDNLPPGSRLRIGAAVVEISMKPHTGCAKFASRFGREALRFVNVGEGKHRRFRGVNVFVVEGGSFAVGDKMTKIA